MEAITLIDSSENKAYNMEVTEEVAQSSRDDPMFATGLLEEEIERQAQEHSGTPVAQEVVGEGCPEGAIETPNDDGFRWGHDAILLLVETYREEEHLFLSRKVSTKVWERIASSMRARDKNIFGAQCKSKWNGLKKTYKSIKNSNGRSGNGRRTWPYLDLMDVLFSEKPWVAPVFTLESDSMPGPSGITSSRPVNQATKETSKENTRKRSREDSAAQLLQALKESREEKRRMQEELLARQDRFLDLFRKLVEK